MKNLFEKPALSADNNLVYESVFSEFDTVMYSPVSNGIKEQIILSEYPGTNVFEFKIELTNLQPLCFKGDSIPLADKSTGEQVAAISQIDMRDSQMGEAFNTSLFNHLELELIEVDLYLLRLVLDDEFLKSESTVYPVIIDPTVTFNADPIYDAPVFSGHPNTNFNGNTYNVVGHHTSSNLKIYVDKTSGFGKLKSTLKSYVKYGLDAWSDLGYTYEFVDTADNCNIYVCGVSRAEAYALGFTNKDGVGVTSNIGETGTSSIYEGQSFSPGGWKSVYSLQKKSIYMIWDTTDDDGIKTSSFSSLKWKTAVAHEIGHALGYEGHCTSSYSLMMEDLNNCMATDTHSPAEMDFEHVRQIY